MMSEVRVSPSGGGSSNGGSPGEEEAAAAAAAAAALRGSRRPPVLPRTAVCRSLFGSPEHGEVEKELKETLAALAEDHRRRWNFDFEAERPLRGRFEWEALDGATVPGCYRTRPLSNNNSNNNNSSSSPNLGLVSNGNPGLLTPAVAATRRGRPQSHGDDGKQSITATVTTTTASATTTTITPTANNSTNNNRKNTDSNSSSSSIGDRGDAASTKSVLRDESPRRGEEDEHGQPGRGGPSVGGDGASGPGGGSSGGDVATTSGGDGSARTSPAGGEEASSSSADVEMIPRDRSASACHDRTRQTPDACSRHKRGSALMEYFPKRNKSDGSPPHPPGLESGGQ